MGETQVLAPSGIDGMAVDNGDAATRLLANLTHSPYFQRFCEERRKPMMTNDSLEHARSACAKEGNRIAMLAEFTVWCEQMGYTDE